MKRVRTALNLRKKRLSRSRQIIDNKSGLGCGFALTIIISVTFIFIPWYYQRIVSDLPSIDTIPALLEAPGGILLQPTRVYDRSGQHLLKTFGGSRNNGHPNLIIDPDSITQGHLVDAIVSIKDPTFWSHPGFSLNSFLHTSPLTITEDLVAQLLLKVETDDYRKRLRTIILANQATRILGRHKVLEYYINSAYFGDDIYGASQAADIYFGKSITNLTLGESAALAAVFEKPGLTPFDTPDAVTSSKDQVIQTMATHGFIEFEEASVAIQEPITFMPSPVVSNTFMDAYVNYVIEQLETTNLSSPFKQGGYAIITTLDYDLQLQTYCAIQSQKIRLGKTDLDSEQIRTECKTGRLLPSLPYTYAQTIDDFEANIVVLDPHSGQILAMVGNTQPGYDPAHFPGHSAGTALSPFVYLTAFTQGFSPGSLVWDIVSEESVLSEYEAFSNQSQDGPISMRIALANDDLYPAEKILTQVGPENVDRMMNQLGISSTGSDMVPFGPEITLLQLAQAYGVVANQGTIVGEFNQGNTHISHSGYEPVSILSIRDTSGQTLLGERPPDRKSIMSPQLAYLITHILSDETARWKSLGHPNPLEIGRIAAAKVGTTFDDSGSWTIGYTPQILTGVWVGSPPQSSNPDYSDQIAAGLWHAVMQYTSQQRPAISWNVPIGLSFTDVCDPSGLLPTVNCPSVVQEIFIHGNEPVGYDNLYQDIQVNRETGRLATVFTPPELIDENVFLIVPPDAVEWASANGIEAPPEFYDVIYEPQENPDAMMTSPEMYTNIRGVVRIIGSASGQDFASYRIQVGEGLNPQSWIQITTDFDTPVTDGILAEWNTERFDGLYAVQLIILKDDNTVDTSFIQVTVDNQPPQLDIPYPQSGQHFTYQPGDVITIQVVASDNVGLQSVKTFLGQRLLSEQMNPPFSIPWRMNPGDFEIKVIATDLAGNEIEKTMKIHVESDN